MIAVPIMIPAIRRTPQRISQTTGPRRFDAATGRGPIAAVRAISSSPDGLEITSAFPNFRGRCICLINGIAVRKSGYLRLNEDCPAGPEGADKIATRERSLAPELGGIP